MEAELHRSIWFAGDAFSAADIQMSYPIEASVRRAGLDQRRPKLMAYLERIRERPAYRRAVERGGAAIAYCLMRLLNSDLVLTRLALGKASKDDPTGASGRARWRAQALCGCGAALDPACELGALVGAHPQPVLGAPDDDVVGGLGPFLGDEITRFALVEVGAEEAAEVGERSRRRPRSFSARAP